MSSDKIVVNSWNEWDPLKHVIVGKADGCCIPAPEPALDAKVPEDSDMKGQYGLRKQDTIDKAIHRQRDHQRATAGKLFKMPKPTIASLPGAAAGAGLSYALSCDLRIMSTDSFMTTAFAKVGFSGDYGGTYFMSQLIGSAKARELYFLSERVSSEEALNLGLTNWVVEPSKLEEKTKEIANENKYSREKSYLLDRCIEHRSNYRCDRHGLVLGKSQF